MVQRYLFRMMCMDGMKCAQKLHLRQAARWDPQPAQVHEPKGHPFGLLLAKQTSLERPWPWVVWDPLPNAHWPHKSSVLWDANHPSTTASPSTCPTSTQLTNPWAPNCSTCPASPARECGFGVPPNLGRCFFRGNTQGFRIRSTHSIHTSYFQGTQLKTLSFEKGSIASGMILALHALLLPQNQKVALETGWLGSTCKSWVYKQSISCKSYDLSSLPNERPLHVPQHQEAVVASHSCSLARPALPPTLLVARKPPDLVLGTLEPQKKHQGTNQCLITVYTAETSTV